MKHRKQAQWTLPPPVGCKQPLSDPMGTGQTAASGVLQESKAVFSVRQKREIASKVQQILRETNHPELPPGEIAFALHVRGAESWSWADIRNNGAALEPDINLHNEAMDQEQARQE